MSFVYDAGGWKNPEAPGLSVSVPFTASEAKEVRLRFRPSDVQFVADSEQPDGMCFETEVIDSVYCGAHYEMTLAVGQQRAVVHAPARVATAAPGTRLSIRVPWDRCAWFDVEGRRVMPPNQVAGV